VRPVEIVKDVHRELGFKISYSKAFSAKERANELNYGTHAMAYQALPTYCEDIVVSNPGSTAILEKTDDKKFKRLFVCYGACAAALCIVVPSWSRWHALEDNVSRYVIIVIEVFRVAEASRNFSHWHGGRRQWLAFPSRLRCRRRRKRYRLALVPSPPLKCFAIPNNSPCSR
jgi:hypothetical protein